MSRASLLVLAAVLSASAGCGNRQKTEADASTSASASAPASDTTASTEPPPRLQRTPPPDAGDEASRTASSTPPSTPGPHEPAPTMPRPPPGLHGMLVPPSTPGASRVALDGCLAQAEATEAAGSRFPVPPTTRGPAAPSVKVETLGTGLLVAHELDHGCCLEADVASSLEGKVVTLTETLSGESCRCRCHSTVRAAVGLKPGEYTLRVVTVQGKDRRVAHEAPVSVR